MSDIETRHKEVDRERMQMAFLDVKSKYPNWSYTADKANKLFEQFIALHPDGIGKVWWSAAFNHMAQQESVLAMCQRLRVLGLTLELSSYNRRDFKTKHGEAMINTIAARLATVGLE